MLKMPLLDSACRWRRTQTGNPIPNKRSVVLAMFAQPGALHCPREDLDRVQSDTTSTACTVASVLPDPTVQLPTRIWSTGIGGGTDRDWHG